jgi:hypothetical protein
MSAKELKEQTIGDAKFWLGFMVAVAGLLAYIWQGGRMAEKLDSACVKIDRLEACLAGMADLKVRVESLEGRISRLEYHPGSASSSELFRRER